MNSEHRPQTEDIFNAALECDPGRRADFLKKACDGDDSLLREVESLLAVDEAAQGFLSIPVLKVANDEMMERRTKPQKETVSEFATNVGSLETRSFTGQVFIERYLIEHELGHGAFGVVYLARDLKFHSRLVVVKLLLEKSVQSLWFRKKFAQEIEALARIDHVGVVGVLDTGVTPDGEPFLVMQYVKGKLRSLMKSDGMDFKLVAQIIRQIGRALDAAHEQGVIHCDLKPENILLQEAGGGEYVVKIVDFGIAKVRNSEVAAGSDKTQIAGTPPYMAQEQLKGHPSAATDIFAMGVIVYEMLTGQRPFNPQSVYQVLDELWAGVRDKPKNWHNLPMAAQEVILKALSFKPEDRYARASDFGELLAQALTSDFEPPAHLDSFAEADPELAHVLFTDIVEYSPLPTDQQTQVVRQLQQIVSGTDTVVRSLASKQLIRRSTGDGIALVFFGNPKAPAQCAMEIARALQTHPQIKLRMGVHSGPVYRIKDVNGAEDVAGAGINMAQRVMDCGDAGHILMSKAAADVLQELAEWRERLHDLGEHKVKHGVAVHLFNLFVSEVGNPVLPGKLRKKRAVNFTLVTAAALVTVAIIAVLIYSGIRKPPVTPPRPVVSELVAAPDSAARTLSYWLLVQKYRNGKPYQKPFQIAGADVIFKKDYRIKLNINSPQHGYFYVLNEPPGKLNGVPRYIIVFASTPKSEAATPLKIEIPEDIWLKFDDKEGGEKLWLIWSSQRVAALEEIKKLDNPQDQGRVQNPDQARAVQDFLEKHSYTKPNPVIERDEEKKQTNLKWKGEVLVYPIEIKHY